MDAWLTHLEALRPTRPTTRAVVGSTPETPQVPFEDHLADALRSPRSPRAATPAWGDVYIREAGLLMGAPLLGLTDDEEAQLGPLRVEPTHAA